MGPLSKFGFVAAMFAVAAGVPFTACGDGPEIGKDAPPLNLTKVLQTPAGASVKWEGLRGKVVVLEFWATSCGPFRESIPHWNELVSAFKDKPVQFIAITEEEESVVVAFLSRTPVHSWVGLGQSLRSAYHIQGIPTAVIVNQSGVVAGVTHPVGLEPKHIQEVLRTGKSSLPPPAQLLAVVLNPPPG
jgi:thiol-disulfide isomerase/thioredoxin